MCVCVCVGGEVYRGYGSEVSVCSACVVCVRVLGGGEYIGVQDGMEVR